MIAGIESLTENPERHSPGRESPAFPVKIRCLLVGKQRSQFRILFCIMDDDVNVLAIRRPAQDFLRPANL